MKKTKFNIEKETEKALKQINEEIEIFFKEPSYENALTLHCHLVILKYLMNDNETWDKLKIYKKAFELTLKIIENQLDNYKEEK